MADTPRHGGGPGSPGPAGWVDSPDLPDPRQWSAPVPSRLRPASRRWAWRRTAPWLVVAALLAATQLPGLLLAGGAAGDSHLGPPDDAVLARYSAEDGVVGEATYTSSNDPRAVDRASHDALWAQWAALVPPYWARRVEVFEVASDGTGPDTFAAYVRALDERGDRWLLAVDPVDAVEQPTHYHQTLVHELAHILTLGDGARTATAGFPSLVVAQQECGGPATRHGCLTRDSLVARFTEQFWTGEDLAAADRIHAAAEGLNGLQDAAVERYLERQTAFVSVYAVTDPAEDIAETATALAFGERQAPGSTAEAKVDFLRQDPEVVALVDRVRATLLQR